MAAYEWGIDLLGPPRFRVDGEPVDIGGPRQEKLLTLLVLDADHVVSVETLVDSLWDEDPPETARRQVHNAVSALRRRLGAARDVVVTDRRGYRVLVPAENVDVYRFRGKVASAGRAAAERRPAEAIAELEAGLAMWRGSALAGMAGLSIRLAAARLEEERLTAVERMVTLGLELGGGPEYVPMLRELVDKHRFRDPFRGQLMLALYRSGRQAEALQVYEQGRAQLADDLGLDMRPDLQRLHGLILRCDPALDAPDRAVAPSGQGASLALQEPESLSEGEEQGSAADPEAALSDAAPTAGGAPSLATVPSVQSAPAAAPTPTVGMPLVGNFLPGAVHDFVGRESEVDRLTEAFDADPAGPVVVCLDGMAGVGKTALALRVAHSIADQFPDGQFFVDLLGHSPSQEPLDPSAALDLLLRAAGHTGSEVPDGLAQRSAAWRAVLARRRALVVLDDARGAGQIRPLIPGAGRSMVLITSRERLLGLDAVDACSLDVLSDDDAIALFARIVGRVRADAEPGAVADVVDLCSRLPLAIRIAASRLRHRTGWTVADLADRLRSGRRLTELVAGDRSVDGAFEVSYRQLGRRHQEVFRALGLHPGRDFDVAAASALAGRPPEQTASCLEELVDVNLLGQYRAGRYHLHDLVRQYAQGKAFQVDSVQHREDALSRLRSHYRGLAAAAMALADPGSTVDVPVDAQGEGDTVGAPHTVDDIVELLRAERANLSAVIGQTAWGAHPEQTWPLAVAAAALMVHGGYGQEALAGLELATRAATAAGDRRGQAAVRLHTGLALRTLGRYQDSIDALKGALEAFESLGDQQMTAQTLRNLGRVFHVLGHIEEALSHYQQALDLAREIGAERDEAAALGNVGALLGCLRKYEEALQYHELSLARSQALANPYLEVIALTNIGWVRSRLGDYPRARIVLELALDLAARIGARQVEGSACWSIGDLLHRSGDDLGALTWAHRALAVAEQTSNPDLESCTHNLIGTLQCGLGQLAAARASYLQALSLCRDKGMRFEEAVAWEGLAAVARAHGDPDMAKHCADQAVALFSDADPDRAATVLQAALVTTARAAA